MEANLAEPLATEDIARLVGVSLRQLERLFKQHMGELPSRWYLSLRLHQCAAPAAPDPQSVMQMGLACGFASGPHFSNSYRSFFGHTPRDERSRRALPGSALAIRDAATLPARDTDVPAPEWPTAARRQPRPRRRPQTRVMTAPAATDPQAARYLLRPAQASDLAGLLRLARNVPSASVRCPCSATRCMNASKVRPRPLPATTPPAATRPTSLCWKTARPVAN
jgi:AraC-like DNA-binding protein